MKHEVVPCDPKVCMTLPRALNILQKQLQKDEDILDFTVVECGSLEAEKVPAFKVYLKKNNFYKQKIIFTHKVFIVKGSAVYTWDNLEKMYRIFSPVPRGSVIKKASDSYRLTSDEVQAVAFARGRYQWADIVNDNLRGRTLTLDNMTQHELREAIDDEGIPLLDDRSDLYEFLIYLEPV